MPYIKEEDRKIFDDGIKALGLRINKPGELNYVISSLCHYYLKGDVCYSKINETIGVLECAKLEAYRRIAAPYEDHKVVENGDLEIL